MIKETVFAKGFEKFQQLLLSEQASLLAGSGATLDVLVQPENLSVEDQARLLHDQFLGLHWSQQEYRKLKKITLALERLGSGEFGTCQECRGPIAGKRLLAIPWAEYCILCQERASGGTDADDLRELATTVS